MSEPAPHDGALADADPPPPTRRRWAKGLVLVGAFAAAMVILPRVPRDRAIDFRVEDAANIVAIDMTWTGESGEVLRGGAWRFAAGSAPRTVTTSVHLASGRYVVDVNIERTGSRDEIHRTIELGEADHITVPLR